MKEVPTRRHYDWDGLPHPCTIPRIPCFFRTAHIALIYLSIFTGMVLLVLGAVKARVTGAARGLLDTYGVR